MQQIQLPLYQRNALEWANHSSLARSTDTLAVATQECKCYVHELGSTSSNLSWMNEYALRVGTRRPEDFKAIPNSRQRSIQVRDVILDAREFGSWSLLAWHLRLRLSEFGSLEKF